MNIKSSQRLAAAIVLTLGTAAAARALTDGHAVAFPDKFAAGVLYAKIDRADLKQYRELYAPAAAVAAIKEGKPMPLGTVLTMVVYALKLDSAGKPTTDAEGRFTRDKLLGYLVMEKGPNEDGAQSGEPASGPWRFQVFKPDQRADLNAKVTDCAECHQKRRDDDYVFTDDRMKAFSPVERAR